MGLFGCCSKNDVTNEDGSMQVFDKTFKVNFDFLLVDESEARVYIYFSDCSIGTWKSNCRKSRYESL